MKIKCNINVPVLLFAFISVLIPFTGLHAQSFDFENLNKRAVNHSVVVEMTIEFSFGGNTHEEEERFLGTIVTDDGMAIFNGTILSSENSIMQMTGYNVKTTPSNITITTLEGEKYKAEYIGVDRYTKIGFIKIIS